MHTVFVHCSCLTVNVFLLVQRMATQYKSYLKPKKSAYDTHSQLSHLTHRGNVPNSSIQFHISIHFIVKTFRLVIYNQAATTQHTNVVWINKIKQNKENI